MSCHVKAWVVLAADFFDRREVPCADYLIPVSCRVKAWVVLAENFWLIFVSCCDGKGRVG